MKKVKEVKGMRPDQQEGDLASQGAQEELCGGLQGKTERSEGAGHAKLWASVWGSVHTLPEEGKARVAKHREQGGGAR